MESGDNSALVNNSGSVTNTEQDGRASSTVEVSASRSLAEIETLLQAKNSDLRLSRSATLTHAAFATPQVIVRTLDRGESFEVRFDVGPTRILTCSVPSELKREAVTLVKELRALIATENSSCHQLTEVVEALVRCCPDHSYLPSHQRAGALWLTLNYWLPDGLRGQLHPGAIRGHVGFRDVRLSSAPCIAAQILGGDAAYFVVRGRDSHEVTGVQFVSVPQGEVTVTAVTGMQEMREWRLGSLTHDNLSKVVEFLEQITHSEKQDLSTMGDVVVFDSPWSQFVQRVDTLSHLGAFATKLESAWTSTPPQLMSSPVMFALGDMNEVGRGKVVARFVLSDEKHLAVVAGKSGVSEIAISPGRLNWFGRKEWTPVWRWSSAREEALDIGQLVKKLRSLDYRALSNGTRRVDLDGFKNSPTERFVERCLALKRMIFGPSL